MQLLSAGNLCSWTATMSMPCSSHPCQSLGLLEGFRCFVVLLCTAKCAHVECCYFCCFSVWEVAVSCRSDGACFALSCRCVVGSRWLRVNRTETRRERFVARNGYFIRDFGVVCFTQAVTSRARAKCAGRQHCVTRDSGETIETSLGRHFTISFLCRWKLDRWYRWPL